MTCTETLEKLTEKINEAIENETPAGQISAYLEGCAECLYMQFPHWHYRAIDKWYFDMKDAIG